MDELTNKKYNINNQEMLLYTCLIFADVVTNDAVENNKNENPNILDIF